jgi:TRAP-type C4-dicarboxylate transport system permease small subunit
VIDGYTKTVKKISEYADQIARICVVLVMLLMVANVTMRTVFKDAITGTYEIVGILFLIMISSSISYCALKDGHVFVSYFIKKFPVKIQKVIDNITNISSIIFFSFISWKTFEYGNYIKTKGEATNVTKIPTYPLIYIIAVGIIVLVLVLIIKLILLNNKRGDNR